MTRRYGTAGDAAEALGVSRAQLDRMRAAATLVIDHRTGKRRRPTSSEARDRGWLRLQHLVAPPLHGEKLPGARWKYDLLRLKQRGEEPG